LWAEQNCRHVLANEDFRVAVFGDANKGRDLVVSSLLARSHRRRCVTAFAMATAVVVLSGCSVEVAGVTGVGLDANGDLVGFIQMCDHHIDGATLYRSDDDELGIWQADEPGDSADCVEG
jgi:hypothetical protein